MPGLSQLKKFSQNLLSIGDEVIIRSSRGEKPVRVKIPKDIVDADDDLILKCILIVKESCNISDGALIEFESWIKSKQN